MITLRRNKNNSNQKNRHSCYYQVSSNALVQICFYHEREVTFPKDMGTFHFDLLTSVFSHILKSFDDPLINNITILIDARKLNQKFVRLLLKTIKITFSNKISQVYLIEPEGFIIQQKINFDILMDAYDYKTTIISLAKIPKYINNRDLADPFGPYGLSTWTDISESFIEHLDQKKCSKFVDKHYIIGGVTKLYKKEKSILVELILNEMELRRRGEQRKIASIMEINYQRKKTMEKAEGNDPTLNREAVIVDDEDEREESPKLIPALLREHCEGMSELISWVRGAGAKWFDSLNDVGNSIDEVKQLDKDLRQLVKKAEEAVDQSRELSDGVDFFMSTKPEFTNELTILRDQMEIYVLDYVRKIKKHLAFVQQSLNFHNSLNNFYKESDILLKILCYENDEINKTLDCLKMEIEELENAFKKMNESYQEMERIGYTFCDNLRNFTSLDEKDKQKRAREFYNISEQIKNAKESRSKRKELVEIRVLKLQQMLQLKTTENDIIQVIEWLNEILTFNSSTPKLVYTVNELYNYGKQLLQVSSLLRRSLRLQGSVNSNLSSNLNNVFSKIENNFNNHIPQSSTVIR
uniref:CRAL-TRIO domain-containing protein n=1 Tax=Strongyloides papillosus TaxID=174720 RepID=A0A0N5BA59_STREA